jgi:NitT/TauT family transport system permease protein
MTNSAVTDRGADQAGGRRDARTPGSFGRSLLQSAQYAAFPVAIAAVWQAVVQIGLVRRGALPAPTEVALALFDLITGATDVTTRYSGTWPGHAAASIWRVAAGFGWGGALGILAGLLIGLSRVMERVFDPTLQMLRSVPVTAWVPLSLVFFGIGNAPAIFLIGLGAFFPVAVNTTHGVRQIDVTLTKAARMMGADRRELLVHVILPGALPSIMTGLRLSMGVAWVLVVVAEMLAVHSGLGYLLNDAYLFYRNDVVIAAMLSIGLLGFACDRLVAVVRNHLLEWNRLETFGGQN